MQEVFVADALRTPIGKYGGSLSGIRPDDMAAHVIRAIVERNPWMDIADIEDVVFGAANQAGEDNRNVARMALLLAGLKIESGGVTVNRLCASGLQAIMDAYRACALGEGNIYLAGGSESMSRAPFAMAKAYKAFERSTEIYDTTIGWRFVNKQLAAMYHPFSMGETAENVAEKFNISREDQDRFAFQSQERYQKAHEAGLFRDEISPIEFLDEKKNKTLFSKDEHPRLSGLDKLAALAPAFKKNGTVTAGNSSGLNDGAACLILASEQMIRANSVQPLAKIKSVAIAGVDPAYMGIGPVPAVQKALKRAGLKISDIGLVELNEAFAAQSLACMQGLELDPAIVNVNGGAIALGHPLGCSGARISTSLLHEMKRRKVRYGIATMCIGVGQGAAIVYEGLT